MVTIAKIFACSFDGQKTKKSVFSYIPIIAKMIDSIISMGLAMAKKINSDGVYGG